MYTRLKRWTDAEAGSRQGRTAFHQGRRQRVRRLPARIHLRAPEESTIRRKKLFARVLAIDPQNAAMLNYLGYMNADRGVKLDESLIYIKKAVDLEPAMARISIRWAGPTSSSASTNWPKRT